MENKKEGFEVLKLKRVQDLFSDESSSARKAKRIKIKRKKKIPSTLKRQLLKNYGFFVEDN